MNQSTALLFVALAMADAPALAASWNPAWAEERLTPPPRAPESAKQVHNPIPATPESVALGQRIYLDVGCDGCHGMTGSGEGVVALGLKPPPRDFTDPRWQESRTDGELHYTIMEGAPGTSMIASGAMFDHPDQVWHVINYIRSLTAR